MQSGSRRMEQFPQVRTQVLQQVTLIDKAMEEFTEAIEKAIEELVQYRNKTVGELQTLKAELSRETETAVEEVERTSPNSPLVWVVSLEHW